MVPVFVDLDKIIINLFSKGGIAIMLSEKYANICQKERPWDLKRVYLFGRYLHKINNTGSLVQVAVQSHTLFHNSSN